MLKNTPDKKGAAQSGALRIIPAKELTYTLPKEKNTIGRGGFGVVYRGQWQHVDAAIKELELRSLTADAKREFEHEANVHASINGHPHIVVLYGAVMDSPNCMVMELMHQSLYDLINRPAALPAPEQVRLSQEIAKGLAFLHSHHILHRDLKSMNVLLDKHNTAKLSDFGLATIKAQTTSQSYAKGGGGKGTLAWMAPELFKRQAQYSPYSDAYAYGMTLWEMAARKLPFADAKEPQLIIAWVTTGERETIPDSTPSVLREIIKDCWAVEPQGRPMVSTILDRLAAYRGGRLSPVDMLTASFAGNLMSGVGVAAAAAASSSGFADNLASGVQNIRSQNAASAFAAPPVPPRPAPKSLVLAPSLPPPLPPRTAPKSPVVAQSAVPAAPIAATADLSVAPTKALQAEVNQLLRRVARGKQEKAEAMAKANPNLLLYKGQVTDYSDRTFKNITAFQYALWALDWHMWEMLLRYLPQAHAKEQIKDLEQSGTEHAKHYNYHELLQSLKTYVDNFDPWKNDALEDHWCKKVGGAQRHVPVHVANEYCRPDRSFDPTPSFTEPTLPRVLTFEDLRSQGKHANWFPLDGLLGSSFALLRYKFMGRASRVWARDVCFTMSFSGGFNELMEWGALDLSALTALFKTRTTQYAALQQRLG